MDQVSEGWAEFRSLICAGVVFELAQCLLGSDVVAVVELCLQLVFELPVLRVVDSLA